LKGETLDARKDFFNNAGTKHLNPQDNDAAYILWMDKLDKLNSRHDKHPWSWIKGLLQRNPEERLGAPELLKTIQLCDDSEDGYVYYCLRCDASVRVPITIPDAQIIREEVEQNGKMTILWLIQCMLHCVLI
jgi:hypothetical protein